MAFNPGVTDQRADIVSQGMGQIADLTYRGAASSGAGLAAGIAQAGESLGNGLEKAGQQFSKNWAQRGANDGLATAMQQFGYGTPEFWDEFAKTKDEDKRSGMLTAGMGFLQDLQRNEQRQQLLEKEYQLRGGLQAAAAEDERRRGLSDRTGQTTTMVDPVTGAKVGGYFQNNRQVVPFDAADAPVAGVKKVDLGNGQFAYMDGRGRPIPASAIQSQKVNPVTALRTGQLKGTVATLEGEVAKRGPDAKNGPNWWPFSPKLGDQLKGAKAELQSLEQGAGSGAAGAGLQGGAPAEYGSAAEVKAAFAAGKISKEQAAEVLRAKFGMK